LAERRNDERDRLRTACQHELAELREADEEETSEVVADVAAKAAARTARHLSKPDSDAPERQPWHRTPAGKTGAILALLSALGALIEALRQLGLIK
jgi:hypothetical protein